MSKFTFFGNRGREVAFALLLLLLSMNLSAQCSTTGWKKFSQGETFSIALKEDGTLWMWGQNSNGVKGDGTVGGALVKHPTQIGTDTDWADISVGRFFVLAKKSNNELYGWGDNQNGNLANGNNTDQYVPIKMAENVKSFSAGYHHTMMVKTDGTMWGAGYNDWGNLAVGTSTGWYNTWQQESSHATDWEKASAGFYNSFGIKTNGTLWSAGTNVEGQTGTGVAGGESDVFAQIGTDTNWKDISCGVYHVLALKTTGKVFGWGYSGNGRLGIAGAGAQYFRTPQAVDPSSDYLQIATSWDASALLKSDKTMYAFGVNHGGIIGSNAGDTNNLAPQQVGSDSNWKTLSLRVGGFHFGAVKEDSSIWAWGTDNLYQLGNGDGTTTNSNTPTQVTCTDDNLALHEAARQSALSVYPNPATDIVYVKAGQHKVESVQVYSTTGALVKTASKVENGAVNVASLPAGVYILKINGEAQSVKLIKK